MVLASHGELFPLPLHAVEPAARTDLSRGTRQHTNRRRASQTSASEAVLALSVASGSCKSSDLASSAATHLTPSRTQSAVLEDIFLLLLKCTNLQRVVSRKKPSAGELKSYARDCVALPMCGKLDCALLASLNGNAEEDLTNLKTHMRMWLAKMRMTLLFFYL